ncbi:MAG TPA: hypothetical protein ENJ82_05215 [Bacteroidetes bacterium]|nr:hypothetical protein [Bacteroidota bacterium]
MQIKRVIPNLFTLGNLACGVLAIILLFHPGTMALPTVAWTVAGLMVAAMLFDFADGFVARLLKIASPLGKQLDSLADMVTFGLLPGLLVYFILYQQTASIFETKSLASSISPLIANEITWYSPWIRYVGLLIPLFSAYRLAKFNIDERSGDHFYGFPTPANAFFFLSIFLIYALAEGRETGFLVFLSFPFTLAGLTTGLSILLVSDFPLLSFKFKNASFQDNAMRYVLLGISVILLPILWYKAMPIIIALYFVLSIIDRAIQKK